MKPKIQEELEAVTTELLLLIASFDQEQINLIPFENSWTAAQVADHLCKSDASIIATICQDGTFTARIPDEKTPELKGIFLNFEVKFKSPDIIIPDNKVFHKEELIVRLKETRSKLFTAATTLNLNEVVAHDILGDMTRLEILSFVLYHTQRHIHQLKRIREKIIPLQQSV
ncbi:DinB family protein [Ohtaekwangia kribbensis]|jgi:hypothetical protein|uniref:DinB family protein n=1 Tax=Ohtaekwangia kribbensis TaxID=688913 RepID=A0ABW3KAL9_9BACT